MKTFTINIKVPTLSDAKQAMKATRDGLESSITKMRDVDLGIIAKTVSTPPPLTIKTRLVRNK